MKKILLISLCITMVLCVVACGKKEAPKAEPQKAEPAQTEVNDSATKQNPTSNADTANSNSSSISSDKQPYPDSSSVDVNSERNEKSDNAEIEANLRDAKELIDNGDIDDAKEIIKAIESRKLTPEQQKKLDALKATLLKVSD